MLAPTRFGAHNWEAVGDLSAWWSVSALKRAFDKVRLEYNVSLPLVSTEFAMVAGRPSFFFVFFCTLSSWYLYMHPALPSRRSFHGWSWSVDECCEPSRYVRMHRSRRGVDKVNQRTEMLCSVVM